LKNVIKYRIPDCRHGNIAVDSISQNLYNDVRKIVVNILNSKKWLFRMIVL